MEIIGTASIISICIGGMIIVLSIFIKPKWKGWMKIIWSLVGIAYFLIFAGWIFKACNI
jgi:hypothetical protein